ncbi:hypothetical protein BaGK_15675 [Bacillus atrophaeus]|nr:hypothetical protein BaGK_15675 [Bacillus atrophaeus]
MGNDFYPLETLALEAIFFTNHYGTSLLIKNGSERFLRIYLDIFQSFLVKFDFSVYENKGKT